MQGVLYVVPFIRYQAPSFLPQCTENGISTLENKTCVFFQSILIKFSPPRAHVLSFVCYSARFYKHYFFPSMPVAAVYIKWLRRNVHFWGIGKTSQWWAKFEQIDLKQCCRMIVLKFGMR
jgi:hypothetical protein